MQVGELDHLLSSLQHGLQEREVSPFTLNPAIQIFSLNRTVQISSLDPIGYFSPSFRTFSMDLNKKARSVDNINHKKIDFKNTFNSIF